MTDRTPYTSTALEVLTSANFEKGPKGWLGFGTATLAETGVTTETDITDSDVTVTVGADRMLMVTGSAEAVTTNAGDNGRLRLYRGATEIGAVDVVLDTTRLTMPVPPVLEDGLAPGSYTYKLTIERVTGSGTITVGSAGIPNPIIVTDVGPASA